MTKPLAPMTLPQPDQPLVHDGHGVIRFQENVLVRALLDAASAGKKMDLNDLALVKAPIEDRIQFAQLIGYSVSGACELSYYDNEHGDRVWRKMVMFGKKHRFVRVAEKDMV